MSSRALWHRCISIVLILSLLLSLVACSSDNPSDNHGSSNNPSGNVIVDDVEINDSFVRLEIKPIQVNQIATQSIEVDEILVHCIEVKDIENLEIEVTTINDEFVYLAYKNFVSVYGEDFSLKDFLVDVGIGATCILVCVTLSVAGGPVGTFFGAVITSEFAASAIVIGAAIDAAVSGYIAYQEGGDASYIIGHMLNGVADGFKWSAILAPVTGAVSGIKALRAVSALKKVPGFEELTDKQARKVLEQLADILKKSSDLGEEISDQALKEVYQKLSKEAQGEITEDLLRNILTNKKLLTDIVLKYNPFNVAGDVAKAMKENFLKNAGLSDSAGKNLIKQLQNGSIKSLNDISDTAVREYIERNMLEFAQLFGSSLSKDFIDNSLKNIVGDDAFEIIKKSIASNSLFTDLVDKLGSVAAAQEIVSNTDALILMQLRYGSKNVNRLVCASTLYRQMLRDNKIDAKHLSTVLDWLMNGTSKSLSEISQVNSQIAVNLCASREVVAQTLDMLGNTKAFSNLLNDMAAKGLQNIGISASQATELISSTLSKADIISHFGDNVYQTLVKNYSISVDCLRISPAVNNTLLQNLTEDALRSSGIPSSVIVEIMKGAPISNWGLSNIDDVIAASNIVAGYYKSVDPSLFSNYIRELAEARGTYVADFLRAADITPRNSGKFAGALMEPSGSHAAYIKATYGDIYMSEAGFVILDEFAIARVEFPDLNGLNGGSEDIARANLLHHGTQASVPGYTWHHLEDGKTLILVPTDLHEAYRHTGGADLLREGLKEAKNG